jgi:hypothetical protein
LATGGQNWFEAGVSTLECGGSPSIHIRITDRLNVDTPTLEPLLAVLEEDDTTLLLFGVIIPYLILFSHPYVAFLGEHRR